MSDTAVKDAAAFTFCPKCGTSLADGCCAKCGWALPQASSYSPAPRKRKRRLEILVGLLTVVIVSSVIVNLLLNFGSVVQWMPGDVLIWVDTDGKGDGGAELVRRLRAGELSDRLLAKLLARRLQDPRLVVRSPFPVGYEQNILVEQNCRIPTEGLSLFVKDWKLSVDGEEVASDPGETRPSESAEEVMAKELAGKNVRLVGAKKPEQAVPLTPMDEGNYELELTGTLLAVRIKDPEKALYSRPVSVTCNLEIKGRLTDYAEPRGDKKLFEFLKDNCYACAWSTGEDDETNEGRHYFLYVAAAMPRMPFVMSVAVRADAKGDFTRVGRFGNDGKLKWISRTHVFSLADVPNIEAARRIQVRMTPDLVKAFEGGHKEFFGGLFEWDAIPLSRQGIGHQPNVQEDEFRVPSRVKKALDKKKDEPVEKPKSEQL